MRSWWPNLLPLYKQREVLNIKKTVWAQQRWAWPRWETVSRYVSAIQVVICQLSKLLLFPALFQLSYGYLTEDHAYSFKFQFLDHHLALFVLILLKRLVLERWKFIFHTMRRKRKLYWIDIVFLLLILDFGICFASCVFPSRWLREQVDLILPDRVGKVLGATIQSSKRWVENSSPSGRLKVIGCT